MSVGISLVMQGEAREACWPASQISAPPGTGRLATMRLGGRRNGERTRFLPAFLSAAAGNAAAAQYFLCNLRAPGIVLTVVT